MGRSPNIFKVSLDADESFLVARSALLAYSLDDTGKTRHPVPERIAAALASSSLDVQEPSLLAAPAGGGTPSYISRLGNKLADWTSLGLTRLRSDNTPFVRMYGPSTLLIQSSSTAPLFGTSAAVATTSTATTLLGSAISRISTGSRHSQLESEIAAQLIAKHSAQTATNKGSHPKDYLKIASVGTDGKVVFESTESFKDF